MAKNELEYTHLGTRGLFASTYSDIRDDSPDEIVRKIQGQYPGVGIRMLKGHPKSQGLTLQRERSRQSLLRLDPTAALQRWLKSTRLYFIRSRFSTYIIGTLSKARRRRQRRRGKTKEFMSRTIAQHERFKTVYIS